MRGVVRGVTLLRELAYNFSAHFRGGRDARTVLYLIVYTIELAFPLTL
jgi:hypothetical protein